MKKLLTLLLALTLVFVFAGCEIVIDLPGQNQDEVANAEIAAAAPEEITVEAEESNEKTEKAEKKAKDSTAANTTAPAAVNSTTPKKTMLTKAEAKAIALKDAGVSASKVRDFDIELDRDYGAVSYEIDFEVDGQDYEYDIDAYSGKIIKKEVPAKKTTAKISYATAKATALKHAGVKEADVYDYEIELSRENVLHYEIDFKAGGYEYSYEINALTGKIIRHEKEHDD